MSYAFLKFIRVCGFFLFGMENKLVYISSCLNKFLCPFELKNSNVKSLLILLLQVWNHDFFWESMQPAGGDLPKYGVLEQIEKDFGSFTNFKEKFTEAALTLFGSGYVWLVCKLFLQLVFL